MGPIGLKTNPGCKRQHKEEIARQAAATAERQESCNEVRRDRRESLDAPNGSHNSRRAPLQIVSRRTRMNTSRRFAPWMVPLTAILLGTSVHKAFAQEQPPAPAQRAASVPTGTPFRVRLEDELNTAKVQKNKRFKVHTLEPLEAANGITIPTGAEIRGHVSGVEPGGLTGRARLWLTFDEIHAPSGRLPIIAEVAGVPGEHSVKQGDAKEGEIEARTSKGRREAESAAAGAAISPSRSEEHTSELQSQSNLVCRLLLEKKKKI